MNTDTFLHTICSAAIFFTVYKLSGNRWTALLLALLAGFGKEAIDSLTHSPEINDFAGNGLGILLMWIYFTGDED